MAGSAAGGGGGRGREREGVETEWPPMLCMKDEYPAAALVW